MNTGLKPLNLAEKAAYGAIALAALCCVVHLMKMAAYGLGLSDESFYLIWIADPWSYKATLSCFGFIYHPLHLLTDGDITAMRRLNMATTLMLSWLVSFLLLKKFWVDCAEKKLLALIFLALLFSFGAASNFNHIFTPSYNTLNLQGFMVVLIGLLLIGPLPSRTGLIGWALLGLGGWMVFMAKPSSAALLAFVVLGYLLVTKLFRLQGALLAVGMALALLIISAYVIDGSITNFILRFSEGMKDALAMDAGHGLKGISKFLFTRPRLARPARVLMLLLVGAGFWAVYCQHRAHKEFGAKAWIITTLFLSALSFALIFYIVPGKLLLPRNSDSINVLLTAVYLGALFALLKGWRNFKASAWRLGLYLAVFLIIMPHIYTFGSAFDYFLAASTGAVFWAFGFLLLVILIGGSRVNFRLLVSLGLCQLLVICFLAKVFNEKPIRQPLPLRLHSSEITMGLTGKTIIIENEPARAIVQLQKLAAANGFKYADPLLDLTGCFPGIVYALGGLPPGSVWNIGGYPGSAAALQRTLERVDSSILDKTWLVTAEPTSEFSLDPAALEAFGRNIHTDYELLGAVETETFYTTEDIRKITLQLYRPKAN